CERGAPCQSALEEMDAAYGAHRIVNLMGAWHQQLVEVLGAMGIREVRRLRGETGRSMFFEDLEREVFGRLFGARRTSCTPGASGSGAGGAPPTGARPAGASTAPSGTAHGATTAVPSPGDDAAPQPGGDSAIAAVPARSAPPTAVAQVTGTMDRQGAPGERAAGLPATGGPSGPGQSPVRTSVPRNGSPPPADVPEEYRVSRTVRPAPPRYRNEIGKYTVRRASTCRACGRCAEVCAHAVHVRPAGYRPVVRPFDYRCVGPECAPADRTCVESCPQQALSVCLNPTFETLGDHRWTPDLLASNWYMAETGRPPGPHLESEVGDAGGGFDRLRLRFPDSPPADLRREDISTQLVLNRRADSRPRITIDVPWYGGGMSFGSTNIRALLGKARAARACNTFTSTGEGGYPERLVPYRDHVITQVATGLFGVREETIQRARIVEFKYAQGAKPGLGGHLLGEKNTPSVAAMRETVVGVSLFSPFPFHSVYSVEDHKKHLDWIAHVNPRALLSAKVSTPVDVDMVAVGVYYAGGHIVHLDGSYGGTGAAPNIAKKNIAMPIEYAIGRVHQFLEAERIREQVTVIASGGLRTPADIAKAIALGADGVVVGTAELVALGCIRCGACESGRGCARGIATTDDELLEMVTVEWCTQRLVNLYSAWREVLVDLLYRLGLDSVAALRGRTDLLCHLDHEG
ncbi:MAG: glutamate synthase-related protein, partial [Candidatus Latescibacterota bacterium]